MVKGRIESVVPTVFLSLSEQELDRLRAGEMIEATGANRLGLGEVRLRLYCDGQLPTGVVKVDDGVSEARLQAKAIGSADG